MRAPVNIPIAFVQGMLSGQRLDAPLDGLAAASVRRHDPAELLQAAGIPPAWLDEPGARVSAGQYVALFSLLVQRGQDEGLGFFSRRLPRGSFALLARCALGAPSLLVAMRRVQHTWRLLQDDVQLLLLHEGGLTGLGLHRSGPCPSPNFQHELLLRVLWRLLAWLHGGRLVLRRVDFCFSPPAYQAGYRTVFSAALCFEQPRSAIWFDSAALNTPVARDEAALQVFLRAAPGNLIVPQRSDLSVHARVRLLLQASGPAWPDLPQVAQALHMSTSTLQRHLAAEGSSFQALKDQLRRDLAMVRLATSRVPLAQLAAELGFADSAAFQRAFKAWTGTPPGRYRQQGGVLPR